ncbi:purine-nucleoside phosphorylase [Haloferula rosea]|uniref:purine-nucleoside phosphorylase n=1 Tax=Haloferula rosea TaxID=490093 RepID=A0A934R993_9BACT|nr:purine-nucleoside phosphorylase [Haloferula rosea]MBK1827549.1 purine-nucleoside phosphorylase [Haloferula rosea]
MNRLVGMVLGSGLGSLVDRMAVEREVTFVDAGLPASGVPGHDGAFVFGRLGDAPVVVMRGRIHLYEGHDAKAVTAGIRWMSEQGVEQVILTNAAGSLHEENPPGSWMVLTDHLNLTGTSPLEGGPNFVDMSEVYDAGWRARVREIADASGLPLAQGVYAGLRGPQYETPAEVRMLGRLGADAVGMSTVLEAMQAKALGMKVLGLSCLTNFAAGLPGALLDHSDVMKTGKGAAQAMIDVIERSLSG